MFDNKDKDRALCSHKVPSDAQDMLQGISLTHNSRPLRAYNELGDYIEPEKVNAAIKDCLVELHFTVKHYGYNKTTEPKYDTFTGEIQQIVILEKAPPKTKSRYEKSLRGGPVRIKPAGGTFSALSDAFEIQKAIQPLTIVRPESGKLSLHSLYHRSNIFQKNKLNTGLLLLRPIPHPLQNQVIRNLLLPLRQVSFSLIFFLSNLKLYRRWEQFYHCCRFDRHLWSFKWPRRFTLYAC